MSLFSKLSKNSDKALYPWSQKKLGGTSNALPRVRHAATAISSDALLVYGGVHRGTPKKDILLIDTNTMSAMSMMTIGDIPNTRISPTIIHINGHILLYGGKSISSEEQYDSSVYLLNLQNKQWTRLSTEGKLTPTERTGHSCSMHEGAVYIWGGQKEGRYFNDLFLFNINPTPRWDSIQCDHCPEPRAGHVSAIYEDKMYIFGGTDGHQHFNDLWSFDLKTRLWIKLETEGILPSAREGCSSAIVDDALYIFGGRGEDGSELNDLCGYKIKNRHWFTFQNMGTSPSPRHGHTMTAIRDRMFVVGGDNDFVKMEDASLVYVLDSTKIKYPLQAIASTAPVEEKPPPPRHDSVDIQPQEQPPQPYLQRQESLQASHRPPQPIDQRQRVAQPSNIPQKPLKINPNALNNEGQQESPTIGSPRHKVPFTESQAPVRPPRAIPTVPEAALRRPRTTSSPHPAPVTIEPQPPQADVVPDEEREMLLREIKARDAIISDMKKKESWWRAEVSMARKLQQRQEDGCEADEALLMEMDHLPEEQVKLFEQLIAVKSELRRVRASMIQTPDKVHQADRMRTAALQEAAYFKSKYLAIKARRQEDLEGLEMSRSDELERRLASALSENETKSKQWLQLQKRSEHDQSARLATEERAREAHERAQEAQEAHQRALEELQSVYSRATKAESQVRENTIKIVNLTQQLTEALTAPAPYPDVSEAQMKAAQLEAANLKARNEFAALKQRLAESMDEIDHLNTTLHERQDALNEAKMNIEDYEIQLHMLRDAVNQKNPVNGFAPTPAY
ncbi:unnamed protein product [Rhizopus stolonifer]